MKQLLAALLILPTAAMAHPGDHGGLSLAKALAHLLGEPDHAAILLAAAGAGLYLLWRKRAQK